MKDKYLYITVLLIICGYFCSCKSTMQPLEKTKAHNNETYEVEYLFEHDGCKVYRFRDMGNIIYFSSCNGEVTRIKNDSTRIRQVTITRQQTSNP